jgi:S-adenosylmethionine synthetase
MWPRAWWPPVWRSQCQVQVAYAIGVAQPMNVTVIHRWRGRDPRRPDRRPGGRSTSTCVPKGVIQMLDLLRPIYRKVPRRAATSGARNPSSVGRGTDKAQALRVSDRAVSAAWRSVSWACGEG